MIPIGLACVLWLPAVLGLGAALLSCHRVGDEWSLDGVLRLSVCGALGCLGLSVLGNAANFFVPVHPYVALAGWILGIACAWRHRLVLLSGLRAFDWCAFAAILLLSAAATASHPLTFDEGVYHLPAIKWLTDSAVPLGLGQLQTGLGFNSSWFTLAACLEVPRLYGRGLFVGLGLVLFLLGLVVYDGLRRVLGGDARLPALIALGSAYPWGLALLRGWADYPPSAVWLSLTDAASLYVVLLVLVVMLRRPPTAAAGMTEGLALASLALLGTTGKLSNFMLVAGAVLLLLRRGMAARGHPGGPLLSGLLRQALRRVGVVWLAVGFIWMFRGVALTGAIAYPSTVGLFEDLPWALRAFEGARAQRVIKAWARAPNVLPPERVLADDAWFEPWVRRMLDLEAVQVCVMLAAGATVLLALRGLVELFRRRSNPLPPEVWLGADDVLAALVMSAGVLQCFVSAPEPRFCLGFLFGLSAWLAATGVHAIALPAAPRAIRVGVALLIVAAGLRGGRLLPWAPGLFVPAWPRIPTATLVPRQTADGVTVYVGERCYRGPLPNSNYLDARLKMRIEAGGLPTMFWYNPSSRSPQPQP